MGVKDFRLSIVAKYKVPRIINLPVVLDLRVVLQAESLKLLGLHNCNLGQNIPENIPFVRLQELRLCNVLIKNENLYKIISSCPLLTTMYFCNCKGLKTIKLEKRIHKYLKHFTFLKHFSHTREECSIEIEVPTLETIKISGSKIRFHSHKFRNLKSLSLTKVETCSTSVEQSQLLFIDAPNIEYFDYSGLFIPSISFAPTSGKSNLKLDIDDEDDAQPWFLTLSNLLQALRQSKIHLNIFQLSRNNPHIHEHILDFLVQYIVNGGHRPVLVQHLHLRTFHLSSYPSFLNGLFCICRPVNITVSWLLAERDWNRERELKELSELWCKIQMRRETGNKEIIWQDLEDLRIEGFDKSRRRWQRLHVTRLSESAL